MNLDEVKFFFGEPRKHGVRVGRGIGSGLGKNCGRGKKGFKHRQGHHIKQIEEGVVYKLYRHLPKRGFNHRSFDENVVEINLSDLNRFQDGAQVNLTTLHDQGFKIPTSKIKLRLKLLGRMAKDQKLPKGLKLELHQISKVAREQIEKAQGSVAILEVPTNKPRE